jgi:hypothetical protein
VLETALITPVLVLFVVGGLVAGSFIQDREVATNAVRQGARVGALLGGQPIDSFDTPADNQREVDNRIVGTVLAAAKLPFVKMEEIDIYCAQGCPQGSATCDPILDAGCGAAILAPSADGSIQANAKFDEYDIVNNAAVANAAQQSFGLHFRRQGPPNEISIGVRIRYQFVSPADAFGYFSRDLSDYTVMRAAALLT